MKNLNGKIALITGGSRGLGKDAALNLAQNGSDVIITYNANAEAANAVVGEIQSLGRKASAVQLDISNPSNLDPFMEKVKTTLKENWNTDSFDFLINNAGIGAYGMVEETDMETFDNLMNIQFKGPYFLTQKALPILNDGGRVVNLSTGLTRFTFPGYSAYASMKGAIEVFTRYLAKEVGARGITANMVAPGAIDNDFNKYAFEANPQVKDIISMNTALGRVGVSEDIGGVVAFLCSEEGRWVNGQRIEVSGGMFL